MSTPEKIEVAKIAASLSPNNRTNAAESFAIMYDIIMKKIEEYPTTQRTSDPSGNPVNVLVKNKENE